MAQTWLSKYSTYEEEVTGSATGITAFAGGGQGSATELTSKFNSVDTCATDKDSVKLVAALIGKKQYLFNNTAKLLSVFPQTGEYINGVINFQYYILPGHLKIFESDLAGRWKIYGQIEYKKYVALLTQSGTSAPVATVLENTIGTITPTYDAIGNYLFVSSSLFTIGKTFVMINAEGNSQTTWAGVEWNGSTDDDNVYIQTSNVTGSGFVDGAMIRTAIEIRVYPHNWQET